MKTATWGKPVNSRKKRRAELQREVPKGRWVATPMTAAEIEEAWRHSRSRTLVDALQMTR